MTLIIPATAGIILGTVIALSIIKFFDENF